MANRFAPRTPAGFDHGRLTAIREKAEELAVMLDKIGNREGSLARTKLDETVMWAEKGVLAQ